MSKSNQLIPTEGRGEVALPEDLLHKAADYVVRSRSERTRQEYARCWRAFETWCDQHGREALPAGIDTVAAYVAWMVDRGGGKKKLAISTIVQALSAIKLKHRDAGHPFDGEHPGLQAVMAGIRRSIAKERGIRRVRPVMQEDLRDMLDSLRQDDPREARDAALLALGWAAALRRSEIVVLDWGQLGSGGGFVVADDKGLMVTLMTSKSSQDAAQTIAVPRTFAPMICDAVENWVRVGEVARGAPLFPGRTAKQHLYSGTVARIIKREVLRLARARGRKRLSKDEIDGMVEQFSGHSMRVGFVTSAAELDVPSHRIRQQTRHKSDHMVSIYIRDVDKFKNSGLKGVGF